MLQHSTIRQADVTVSTELPLTDKTCAPFGKNFMEHQTMEPREVYSAEQMKAQLDTPGGHNKIFIDNFKETQTLSVNYLDKPMECADFMMLSTGPN